MRLARVDAGQGPVPAAIIGEEAVDLSGMVPSVEALVEGGAEALAAVGEAIGSAARRPLAGVRLLAPIAPGSLRDFLAFEDHAKAGAARRGEEVNPAWYEFPVYYKGNHRAILGPDEPVAWPSFTERLDFELELACVVGRRGRDLTPEQARDHIFGYTIMNDWSARDVQRAEMALRLGPAKSKDFATSLGPWIVTADELDPARGLAMRVHVNDEVWFEGTGASMHWSFAEMIAHVSTGEDVWPGDVYGSGTVHRGCGLDLDRWIARGDIVTLEIEGIGALRTPVV